MELKNGQFLTQELITSRHLAPQVQMVHVTYYVRGGDLEDWVQKSLVLLNSSEASS